MKLKKRIILIPMMLLSLTACDFSFDTLFGNTSTGGETTTGEETTTDGETTGGETTGGETTGGETTGGETTGGETTGGTIEGDSESEVTLYTITLNSDDNYTQTGSSNYSTGSYDTQTMGDFSYDFYRAYCNSSYFVQLIPFSNYYGTYVNGEKESCFTNSSIIKGIKSIKVTYTTSSSTGTAPSVSYGVDQLVTSGYTLPLSTSSKTVTVNTGTSNYFAINGGSTKMSITSVVISYTGIEASGSSTIGYAGNGKYRINPVTYSGTLTSGSSTITVPTSISQTGSSYTISSSKKYTYYTYAGIKNDSSLADDAAMIDPVDVSNYVIGFNAVPANYHDNANSSSTAYSTLVSYFGNAARVKSIKYTRTTGYMTALPYASSPVYYEYDIAFDTSYSSSSRGVGRVVVLTTGFNTSKATNYGTSQVALYTDDHYATFQEYYNNGSFSERFNGERTVTGYQWSCPTTLS